MYWDDLFPELRNLIRLALRDLSAYAALARTRREEARVARKLIPRLPREIQNCRERVHALLEERRVLDALIRRLVHASLLSLVDKLRYPGQDYLFFLSFRDRPWLDTAVYAMNRTSHGDFDELFAALLTSA